MSNHSQLFVNENGLLKELIHRESNTGKKVSQNPGALNIIHLDDHLLFSHAVYDICIHKNFPNAKVTFFQNGDDALAHVLDSIRNKKQIDLIITDFAHPGLNGIVFSESVRMNESHAFRKIPILFLSMQVVRIVEEYNTIPFARYLGKNSDSEDILEAIMQLLE